MDRRIRDRYVWEARELAVTYPAILWAARRWFSERNPAVFRKLTTLLNEIKQEAGLKARLAAPLAGRVVLSKLRKEDRRLRAGQTTEPPTFYEMNAQMLAQVLRPRSTASPIKWVTASG